MWMSLRLAFLGRPRVVPELHVGVFRVGIVCCAPCGCFPIRVFRNFRDVPELRVGVSRRFASLGTLLKLCPSCARGFLWYSVLFSPFHGRLPFRCSSALLGLRRVGSTVIFFLHDRLVRIHAFLGFDSLGFDSACIAAASLLFWGLPANSPDSAVH